MANKIANTLLKLKGTLESITYIGDFLLSVNKFSHYWIFLEELWTKHPNSYNQIESILQVVFNRLFAQHGSFTVFSAGAHTGTSEEEVPIYKIADDAVNRMRNNSVGMLRTLLDPMQSREFHEVIPPGKYVGVFAFSIHIDLIEDMITNLRSRGCEIVAIVAVIEREKVSRKHLAEMGVELIPLIIVDDNARHFQTILEAKEFPYRDLHKYFQDSAIGK